MNSDIHALWIGGRLSKLEILTIKSFLSNGHVFHLWTYNPVGDVPAETIVEDANEIIPEDQVFIRSHADEYGIGKNSYALFSDLFRYKLLFDKGGWWTDMDVTCLQPFDINAPYFFRAHPILPAIGNVMKAPKGAEAMKVAFEKTQEYCNHNTRDWLHANRILCDEIITFKLEKYIIDDKSVGDWWEDVEPFIFLNKRIPKQWMFIHWMNEEWKKNQLDKEVIYEGTAIGSVASRYKVNTDPFPIRSRQKYLIRWHIGRRINLTKVYFWQVFHNLLGRWFPVNK